jgi:hypothetical protein
MRLPLSFDALRRRLPIFAFALVSKYTSSTDLNARCLNRSKAMNIFYIIGVVVVVIVVAGYLGVHL